MKILKTAFIHLSSLAAPLALAMAFLTANSTCFFLSYQPDEPSGIREMMAQRKRR